MDPAALRDGLVRPAVAADAAAIATVHVATWQAAYAGLLPAEVLAGLDVSERAERWHARLAAPPVGVFALVWELYGQVHGFVSAGPDRQGRPGGEVFAIYVHPEYQGQGAGRQLLAAAAARLAESGFAEAGLWVLAGNRPARDFYESQGWCSDGSEKPWTYEGGGESLTEVRYAASLTVA